MSVLIKDVDKDLYAQFKAAAAMRGIKIGEALQLAIMKWLNEDTPLSNDDRDRIRNNSILRRLLPDLILRHEGKWVIISDGKLVGIFPNREEAIKGIETNNLENYMNIVTPIKKEKRIVTLGFGRKLS